MNDLSSWISWILEIAFAITILFVEGILHLVWPLAKHFFIPEKWNPHFFSSKSFQDPLLEADVVEMASANGYCAEEHYIETKDGYILCLHHLNSKTKQPTLGPVLFMHGCLMSAEGWLARFPDRCLPYLLVNAGFDVWLGNNRGNKYSYKHIKYSTTDEEFWNFCIDDIARYDLPALINYILNVTQSTQLAYIGFSQGTAQAFAAFSSQPKLAAKIKIFIALAPVATIKKMKNQMVEAVSASRPKFIYLLFGKKIMLSQTLFWRKVLRTDVFDWIIEVSMKFLFGWDMSELDPVEKSLMYSHLYSYSSVKGVVQWFQIMKTGSFQMYDDNIQPRNTSKYQNYKLPSYQLHRIPCKTVIFWGGRDTLPNMNYILKSFPDSYVQKEERYEHLDFIFAKTAPERVYSKILQILLSS